MSGRSSRPTARAGEPPRARFFATRARLRAWFLAHHDRATELWIAYPKRASTRVGLRYPEVLEEALCFGWVDGRMRSLGPEAYANRYTPRRPGSSWSPTNIAAVNELRAAGRMHAAGIAAFERRASSADGQRAGASLDPKLAEKFLKDPPAWTFFAAQPAGYRRTIVRWVMSAQRPSTRERRFATLVRASRGGQRLHRLAPGRELTPT